MVAEWSCIAPVRGLVVRATNPDWQTRTCHLCQLPKSREIERRQKMLDVDLTALVCFCGCDQKQLKGERFYLDFSSRLQSIISGISSCYSNNIYNQERRETKASMLPACCQLWLQSSFLLSYMTLGPLGFPISTNNLDDSPTKTPTGQLDIYNSSIVAHFPL